MGNNSVPKFIFRLSRFLVYRGSVLGRFYCICKCVHSTTFPIIITCLHDVNVRACARMHVCVCVSYPTPCKNEPLQLFVNTYFSLIYTDVSYTFGMTPAASPTEHKKKKIYEASRTNKLTGRKSIQHKEKDR